MLKHTVVAAALAAAFVTPVSAAGASDKELQEIRAQIRAMKDSYEARLQALEERLQQAQAASAPAVAALAEAAPVAPATGAAPPAAAATASNIFNPNISMILGGTLSNLSQAPKDYRLQGFLPSGGEAGPGNRGFNLGESELTMAAN